jgi:hypothetical protein
MAVFTVKFQFLKKYVKTFDGFRRFPGNFKENLVKWSNLKPINLPVTGNIFTGNGKVKNRKFTGN